MVQPAPLWKNPGMIAVFFVLFVLVSLLVPNFFSWVNLNGLALSVATVGIIACTMLFCLAAGDLVGLVNGIIIARVGINALITTLATMQVVRGLSYIVSDGKAIGIRE